MIQSNPRSDLLIRESRFNLSFSCSAVLSFVGVRLASNCPVMSSTYARSRLG